ncbi:MAG: SAM-dependent methyltransferase, partial [Pseudomonadota bacterium]
MGFTKSPQVASSQTAVHKNLEKVVARYLQNEFQNSIPKHAHDAFNIAQKFIQERNSKIILDSGCGTAESTHYLARQHPDYVVIGLDKSSERLGRCAYESSPNLLLLHADCIQFWQLAQLHHWRLQQHYLFYPNPWPKPGHLQRRWHAHPVFPSM